MVPRTFPSTYASNGQQQMLVHFLTDVTGLQRWLDYIPVKLSQGGTENSYNNNGYIDIVVTPITSISVPYKDYVPVYVDSAATDAWQVNSVGFIPYGYALFSDASMILDFTNGSSLDPRITFSRASNATVVGPDGTLQYAPHNLLTFSEQFDNAAWAKTAATITANSAVAPDGTSTVDKLVEDTANTSHFMGRNVTVGALDTLVYSVYAKASERSVFNLRISDGVTGFARRFDLNDGTSSVEDVASTSPATVFGIEPVGNGWYRCFVGCTMVSGTSTNLQVRLNNEGDVYTGDGTSGLFIWGAQLNVGALQPYYPTTVKNLLGFTQEFDNAAWTKTRSTVTANATTAPDGSLTADKLVENTDNNTHLLSVSATVVTNSPYVASIYAKAEGRGFFRLQSFNAIGDAENAVFNLTNGTISSQSGSPSAQILSVGNGWYRCSITLTNNSNTLSALSIQLYQDASTGSYTGDGTSGIFIWGAQLSDSASLDPYVYNPGAAPTSTAYYGPRFDYDPVTLAPRGLLVEEQRTNLLTYSEQFDNAAWAKNSATVTANATTAPDGSVTADLLTATATSSSRIRFTTTQATSTTHTVSIYAKQETGRFIRLRNLAVDASAWIDLQTGVATATAGANAVSTLVGNGWYRLSLVAATSSSISNNLIDIQVVDALGSTTSVVSTSVFIWGAQLEVGAFPTSYIPTTTAAATRAADVASMTGANFSNWFNATEGTVYFESQTAQGTNAYPYSLFGANTQNRIFANYASNNRIEAGIRVSNVFEALTATPSNSAPLNTFGKGAAAYKVNDFGFSWNGAAALTDTSTTLPTVLEFDIGNNGGAAGNFLNGHIRRIAYFPRRLSNAELQAITS